MSRLRAIIPGDALSERAQTHPEPSPGAMAIQGQDPRFLIFCRCQFEKRGSKTGQEVPITGRNSAENRLCVAKIVVPPPVTQNFLRMRKTRLCVKYPVSLRPSSGDKRRVDDCQIRTEVVATEAQIVDLRSDMNKRPDMNALPMPTRQYGQRMSY
jgi:hypothetical protein